MLNKVKLRFWDVAKVSYDELLAEMEAWRSLDGFDGRVERVESCRRAKTVFFCEAMGVARAWFDKKCREKLCAAYKSAEVVTADGTVVKKLAKIGGEDIERLTGPNLFPKAMEYGLSRGWRHYFYGTNEETLKNLKAKLEAQYPGIQIVGTYAPPYCDDPPVPLQLQLSTSTNRPPVDFFWVGLGCPKQEIWCAKHAQELDCAAMLAVGAVFDFYGGASPKIPKIIDKLDLVWVWRILTGGKRTLKRDLYCVPRAAWVLIAEFIRVRIFHRGCGRR